MDNYHFLLFCFSVGTFCPSYYNSYVQQFGIKAYLDDVDRNPYISFKMRHILNMIGDYNSIIPIEKIIPACKVSSRNVDERAASSYNDRVSVAVGYSDYKTLYSRKSVLVTAEAAQNFGIQPGVYYATCRAVTYHLVKDRPISLIAPYSTDIMGVNPETLTEKGYSYSLTITSAGKYSYVFTTYIWALSTEGAGDFPVSEWVCRSHNVQGGGCVKLLASGDYMENLQWRYID